MINNNNKKDDIVVSGLDQCGCGLYACCSQFSNSLSFLIRGILKKKKSPKMNVNSSAWFLKST